jgi:hypothetical protein
MLFVCLGELSEFILFNLNLTKQLIINNLMLFFILLTHLNRLIYRWLQKTVVLKIQYWQID